MRGSDHLKNVMPNVDAGFWKVGGKFKAALSTAPLLISFLVTTVQSFYESMLFLFHFNVLSCRLAGYFAIYDP
jgi:hypothetical protein